MKDKKPSQLFEGPHGKVEVWQGIYCHQLGYESTKIRFIPVEKHMVGWCFENMLTAPLTKPITVEDALAFSVFARAKITIEPFNEINVRLVEITL